jgi:hypothetical protein
MTRVLALMAILGTAVFAGTAATVQDTDELRDWKPAVYGTREIKVTINGKETDATLKAKRFDAAFTAHEIKTCLGEPLKEFFDRTGIDVLFPDSQFKAELFSASIGHVHHRKGQDEKLSTVVTDDAQSVRFDGDAVSGTDIYFIEQARGFELEGRTGELKGKSLGQVVFPPNVVRMRVSEPSVPFPDSDLAMASPISDFDFQLQLHLSEKLSSELRGLDGVPPIEVRAGANERLIPRLSAVLKGNSRTSVVLILPYPKGVSKDLQVRVNSHACKVELPERFTAQVPKEAIDKAAEISYELPKDQRPSLAYGLLTKPLDAKLQAGSETGTWKIQVPTDSYAILRCKPRAKLNKIEFSELVASEPVTADFSTTLPQHPMHTILTSEHWKQAFAALAAPIPMLMVGPPGGISGVNFANPGTGIGNPISNAFGFASTLVASPQVRAQSQQTGVFFLWAPPPPTQPTGQATLPKVQVEFLPPEKDEPRFAFCFAPECECHKEPPKVHAAHNPAQFACLANWDHKTACPCSSGGKCERKSQENKVLKMKITIEGVPWATLDYHLLNVEPFRISSSVQQLVLQEGENIVTVNVLFKPLKSGTYGPKSVDFLRYQTFYYDQGKIQAKPAWASVNLKGEALTCGLVWTCAPRGGSGGVQPKPKEPKIIIRNGRKKSVTIENVESKIQTGVPSGGQTAIPVTANGNQNTGVTYKEQLAEEDNESVAVLPFTLPGNPGISYNGNPNVPVPANVTPGGEGLVTRTISVKLPPGLQASPDQVGVVDQAGNLSAFDPEDVGAWHYDADGNLVGASGRIHLPEDATEITGAVGSKDKIEKFGDPKKVVQADYSLKIEPIEKDWVGKDVTLTINMTELVRADVLSRPKEKKDQKLVYDVQVVYKPPDKLRFKHSEGLGAPKHTEGKAASGNDPVVPGLISGTVTVDPKTYDPEKPSPQLVKVFWNRSAAGEIDVDVVVDLRK